MYRIGKEEIDAVARAIYSKDFFKINGSGQEVKNFEEEWKEYMGSEYCLLMTSGMAALTSALIGLGIGPGDEVVVPAYTYIATALAVTSVGAIPVIADIDETLTLDVADFEKKISEHTKAVIPVHIMRMPASQSAADSAVNFSAASVMQVLSASIIIRCLPQAKAVHLSQTLKLFLSVV